MRRNPLVAAAVGSVVGAVTFAAAFAVPAAADPDVAPPIPDVFANMPVNPSDYTVNAGKWFGFAGPPGVVCILDTLKGGYGCAGPLPGAPGGANLVSGGPVGLPEFAVVDGLEYAAAGPVRPLPPNTRLTYRQVSCGVDDAGVVACLNSRDQVGFVVGPTASYAASNRLEATALVEPPPAP